MLLLPLFATAMAATIEIRSVPWSAAPYQPASTERAARGPGLLAVGPGGVIALYDPVRHQVLRLDGGPTGFPVAGATSLAFAPGGDLLLLDDPARRVQAFSPGGDLLASMPLPAIVPLGGRLVVRGQALYDADVFGNLHPLADLSAGLAPATAPAEIERPGQLTWDGRSHEIRAGGAVIPLPAAIQASAQPAGDWLVIDQLTGDHPFSVRRFAAHVATGQRVELPVAGRVYVPQGDFAAGPDGDLYVLEPLPSELQIWRIVP